MTYENYIVYPEGLNSKEEMENINNAVEMGGRVHSVHMAYHEDPSYPCILYVIEWNDE